jgi:hypothetical protein
MGLESPENSMKTACQRNPCGIKMWNTKYFCRLQYRYIYFIVSKQIVTIFIFFVYSSVSILPRNPFIIKIEAIEYNVCHIYEVIEYDVCHIYEAIQYDLCHAWGEGGRRVGPNFCPYISTLPFSSCFTIHTVYLISSK